MVTKPHPIITTVPYHDVSVDCSWHRLHILLFIYLRNFLLRNPFYGHLQVGEKLGGRKSVSSCNNNLTFLWLVLLKIYKTLCVWTNVAKIACLFQSLYLPGHQILHFCSPWRLLGHGPLPLRSLLPFFYLHFFEIIKFFTALLTTLYHINWYIFFVY